MPIEHLPAASHGRALLTQRIRRLARLGEIMCGLAIVALVGTVGLGLIDERWRDWLLFGGLQLNGAPAVQLNLDARKTVVLLILPVAVCQAFALWAAMRMFRGYRHGEIFTATAARQLIRMGWAILAMAPIGLLAKLVFATVISGAQPGGVMSLSVSVADFDFSVIAFGLIAILAGKVLAEAGRVAEENQMFI
jgi:Protein of unknown function (DUF2975)